MLPWTYLYISFGEHKFPLLLGECLEVDLLGYLVYVFSALLDTSNVAVPLYTPTGSIWEFQLFCDFTHNWYYLSSFLAFW